MLYGCETWTVINEMTSKQESNRDEAFEKDAINTQDRQNKKKKKSNEEILFRALKTS